MADQLRVPDFFADGVKVNPGPFGFTLTLFLSDTPQAGADQLGRPIARLRLAPELARALASTLTQATSQNIEGSASAVSAPDQEDGPVGA